MQIKKGERIGGVPIEDMRRLVRVGGFGSFTVADVQRQLEVSAKAARALLSELRERRYVELTSGKARRQEFRWTEDAGRLAAASFAKPLHRRTAERLLEQLIARAREINANDEYAFVVKRLELFGSVLAGSERPGDVDIAVTTEARYTGEKQHEVFHRRIKAAVDAGRNFPLFIDRVGWPQEEIKRILRGRSRGLSFSLGGTPEQLGTARKTIFERGGIGDAPASR